MNQVLSLAILLLSQQAFAQGGGTHVGGGDGECENRIHSVRRDLLRWVTENQFQGLQLQYGIGRNEYVQVMEKVLRDNEVAVTCTRAKVMVAGAEKTCRNITELNGRQSIECNFDAITNSSQVGLYRTVHHEFASLVQVERSVGANSDYFVSDQIQEYPEVVMTVKMGIKKNSQVNIHPAASPTPVPFPCASAYEAKMQKIEKNRSLRTVGDITFVLGTAAGGMAITMIWPPFMGLPMLAFGLHEMVAIDGMGVWRESLDIESRLNRESGLIAALALFKTASYTTAEVIQNLEFDAHKKWKKQIKALTKEANTQRAKVGLPPIQDDETERLHPFQSVNQRTVNWIDLLSRFEDSTTFLSKKVHPEYFMEPVADTDYETIRQKVIGLMQTDAFCPNGKALSLKQILSVLRKTP